jgi:hypothetical protein
VTGNAGGSYNSGSNQVNLFLLKFLEVFSIDLRYWCLQISIAGDNSGHGYIFVSSGEKYSILNSIFLAILDKLRDSFSSF